MIPEEMIQHIQSFLNVKEAAQTSIISKSWYEAWLTRPDLIFSLIFFVSQDDFVKVMKRTLERYEESKLKIHRFQLWLDDHSKKDLSHDIICLGIEWIKKAMKLGATNVDITIPKSSQNFVLPRDVLESEYLVELSVFGGKIDGQALKVSCSRLKTLTLSNVCIQGNTILDIMSVCPMIENLELSYCYCTYPYKRLVWGVNDLHKLKILSLENVKIGEWFFRVVSKSPYLEDLSLIFCRGFEEIQICSDSLESITINFCDEQRMSRAKFDVPRIRKFWFAGYSSVPSLCFKTSSMEWKSFVSFHPYDDSSPFLVKLRKFLSELSSSKIYLHLWTYITRKEEDEEEENMILGPMVVDTLSLSFGDSPFSIESNALKDLFWSYRPKFINRCSCMKPYDLAELICYTTIKEERENRNTSPLHDLEKVDVVILGQIAWTWSRGCTMLTNTRDEEGDKFVDWDDDTYVCLQWR